MRISLLPARLLPVLLLIIVLFSCNRIPRRYIIPPKKMVNVLVDIHLADGMADENMRHSSGFVLDSASLYGSVFKKYGVTRAQFDSTMNYYSEHPDDLQKMYNQVTARLKRLEDELEAAQGEEKKE